MTSNSKTLLALARNFSVRSGRIDERVDIVILNGTFETAEEQIQWLKIRDDVPPPFVSVQIYDHEIGGDVVKSDAFDPSRPVQLTIVKPRYEYVATFLFSKGAASYLKTETPLAQILSAELDPRGSFRARGLVIEKWNFDSNITPPAQCEVICPRKVVRDYVPSREIVDDLSPWLIVEPPEIESPEFDAWRRQASRRLLGGLVNSSLEEQKVVWLQASGPPMFRIQAESPAICEAWQELTDSAEWVFLMGSDIEVRHLIFAAELARAQRPNVKLSDALAHALESARTTYEAHVQSASRETLKALADLRKTVIDETQKVSQRTQDLTSGLWRDIAVATTPFVIKVLGDATKTPNPVVAGSFYLAAAIFIVVSFWLQIRINEAFFRNQKKARTRWLETLYAYVSATERKEIAEEPIDKAVASYRDTRGFVGLIYLTLVIVLLGFSITTFCERSAPAIASHETSGMSGAAVNAAPGTLEVQSDKVDHSEQDAGSSMGTPKAVSPRRAQ